MVSVVEIGKKKLIQPEDICFQCQANSLKNMSAYFYFSNTFIIVLYKRSEIRKPLIVMSIQWQTSSRTDLGSTLHRARGSNSRLLMVEMAIAILLWGKSKMFICGTSSLDQ